MNHHIFQSWSYALMTLGLSFVLGCSGGGGGGGGATPKNPQEALRKLSPQHQAAVEKWKANLVKSCIAADVLGVSNEGAGDQIGLDGSAFLISNGKSAVIRLGDDLAIASGFSSFSGTSESTYKTSTESNGQVYKVEIMAQRVGSKCSVYIYGQKVYETELAETVSISSFISQNKAITVESPLEVKTTPLNLGFVKLENVPTSAYLKQFLAPQDEMYASLAEKYGISIEQARQIFKTTPQQGAVSIRMSSASSLWSNAWKNEIIAPQEQINSTLLTDGNVEMEVLIIPGKLKFLDTTNVEDKNPVRVTVQISAKVANGKMNWTLADFQTQLKWSGAEQEIEPCLVDRAQALADKIVKGRFSPSYNEIFDACSGLTANLAESPYTVRALSRVLEAVMAFKVITPNFNYNGWHPLLYNEGLKAAKRGLSIGAVLDPNGRIPIVQTMSQNVLSVMNSFEPHMQIQNESEALFSMVLDWALAGAQVQTSRMPSVLKALENAYNPFKESTLKLINQMAFNLGFDENALIYCANLNPNFKMKAVKAMKLAVDIGYSDFERDLIGHAIQRRLTEGELDQFTESFAILKNELRKYPNLGPFKNKMVGSIIRWSLEKKVSVVQIRSILAAVDNVAQLLPQSTEVAMDNLKKDYADNQAFFEYAASVTTQYKTLSQMILEQSAKSGFAQEGERFVNRILIDFPTVLQVQNKANFWKHAWAFSQREGARAKNDTLNDWNRKDLIKNGNDENWTGDEFTALEAIVELGKQKTGCSFYKGFSSLADCLGGHLFSNKDGKFFSQGRASIYNRLAAKFVGYLGKIPTSQLSLRFELIDQFFNSSGVLWSRCSTNDFNAREQALGQLVDLFTREKNAVNRFEIERDIKENLRNCN